MANSGWIALAGAVAGGTVAGSIALLQARYQHRHELQKAERDHRWQDERLTSERTHADAQRARDRLMDVYTRYQLAADRLEDAARGLGDAVRSAPATAGHEAALDRHATAQSVYDEAFEVLNLVAPAATVALALAQRRLLNRLVREALAGTYDDEANRPAIAAAAEPLLRAMRIDLGTRDPR